MWCVSHITQMDILGMVAVLCLLIASGQSLCDRIQREGSHIEVSSSCHENGSVIYQWDIPLEQQHEKSFVTDVQICYNCTSLQQTQTDCQINPNQGTSSLSFAASAVCVFKGCYLYSKASADYPTLGVPAAICTSPPQMSSRAHVTSSTVILASTSVPSSSVSEVQTSSVLTSSVGHSQPSDNQEGSYGMLLFIALPVAVGVTILVVIVTVIALLIIVHKRRQSEYKFRQRINQSITRASYDNSVPDPVSVCSFTPLNLPEEHSLFNYLINDPKATSYQEVYESEPEMVLAGHGTDKCCDTGSVGTQPVTTSGYVDESGLGSFTCDGLSFDIPLPEGSCIQTCADHYQRDVLSPTPSDQSGYVVL